MTFALIIFTLALTLGFLFMLRIEDDRALRLWAASWGLYLAWMVLTGTVEMGLLPNFDNAHRVLTTSFAIVGTAGAYAYAGRSMPRPMLVCACMAAVLRLVVALSGHPVAGQLLMAVVDPTLLFFAGHAIYRSIPHSGPAGISLALSASYIVSGIGLGTFAFVDFGSAPVIPQIAAWGAINSLAQGGLQLFAIVGRMRRRAQNEHRNLRAVIDTAPLGVLLEDADGRVSMANRQAGEHLWGAGAEIQLGATIDSVMQGLQPRVPQDAIPLGDIRDFHSSAEKPTSFELTLHNPDPMILSVFTSPVHTSEGQPLGRVWVSRDITEDRRLEESLRQSQRLDTLGRLAGGIAHDFNNQLTAILGNARVLRRMIDDGDARECIDDLEIAADHCAGLTRSLLAFARRAPVSPRSIRIEEVLEEVGHLLRPLIPSTIELSFLIAEDVVAVEADPTQLHQAIVNLAINARDAIEGRGRIEIAARNRARKGETLEEHPDLPVEISVRDDGAGMDAGTLARIFEPFYSTKAPSDGTGLGLSIVYGAMKSHGGHVEVESQLGEGTTFRLLLPASETKSEPEEIAPPRPTRRSGWAGCETILLVDDEDGIRRMTGRTLEEAGYRVLYARDGDEALEIWRERASEVALVLADVTMPGRSGPEVVEAIRGEAPDLPAILTSGLDLPEGQGEGVAFLRKPYDLETLTTRIRELLDQPSSE